MRYLYALAISLLVSYVSFSQTVTVKGKVTTDANEALQTVTVMIKGTKTAVITDKKGKFSISVPKFPVTLVFSYVGFEVKELVVKEKDSLKYISMKLHQNETSLDEVVVVGYGVSRKRDVTGSVSSFRGEKYTALEGRAPGVSVYDWKTKIPDDKSTSGSIAHKSIKSPSKILTAGELSDFKKWKLWEDYTKNDFKQWSEQWGISPVSRYCVQVQNDERRAIAGEKVFLINSFSRDTVWRSVTDNTGKAELWANFNVADSKQETYVIVCDGQTTRFPTTFENGINRIIIKRNCDQSSIADIAFVVDATGSMGDEISYLKEELQDVIANISANNKHINLRTGSVFYRDKNDQYLVRSIDFQNDPSSLIGFIKNQSAGGGGDYEEAVEDALATALDSLHWDNGARAKIIFLILDAPPHKEAKDKMKQLMVRAASMGVRIVPVVCSGIDKSTEYLMRSIALATNGSYVFLTDDSGVGGKHIKPTTDNFKVELLNDLLQRLVSEMIFMASCNENEKIADPTHQDSNIAKVTVYPNPSSGRIHLKSSEKIKELYITDFAGKILQQIIMSGKNLDWQSDLSNYPSGTYLIRYFIEEKGWGTEKFVLMK
jgi:hypothetical protein